MDERFLLNEQLKSSGDKLNTVYNSVSELQNAIRQQSREFYFRLSLMSGGIISLSITYIGYLSSLPHFGISYAELLFGGWIALGLSLIGSLYRNHFNLDMGHWQTIESLNRARLENDKATLKLMEKNPEQFIDSATNKVGIEGETIRNMKLRIKKIEDAIKDCDTNNKRNELFWLIFQKTSHIGFVVGVIFVTLFASLNIPVPVNFTLFNWLTTFIK